MSMRDAKGDPKKIRPPKPKPANPIAVAIKQWLATLRSASAAALEGLDTESLLSSAPKRFTIYEPMVLLPSGSFDSPAWQALLSHPALDPAHVDDLWHALLQELSKKQKAPLTHLAANQGIPPLVESDSSGDPSSDNILRSPSGLRMLYGDFGPATSPSGLPSHDDFARAFWVSTRQNGIWQTWAPRWTMFSRGNVKEKARLLAFHADAATATFPHRAAVPLPSDTGSTAAAPWAVDMYAGIGYFTFSYARLGMRVLCWELNPWSSRFDGWARGEGDEGEGVTGREARVEHVELVKTYAPDVWHCVFDVCILKVHD
ncbi:hypothetical protein VdG1_02032 [Verticillium dahliae VDG1]|nr:hypothetical protein VdG1_02032 [Verticillium dahliae VDG1]